MNATKVIWSHESIVDEWLLSDFCSMSDYDFTIKTSYWDCRSHRISTMIYFLSVRWLWILPTQYFSSISITWPCIHFLPWGLLLNPAFLQTKHSFCLLLMYAACFNFEVHLVSSRKTRTCNFSLINFTIFSIFTILTKLGYMQDFLSVGCNNI